MKKSCMIVVLALSVMMMASCASSKSFKKEVRKYKKEGWEVQFGHPFLEDQLKQAQTLRSEVDESGYGKYIEGGATSVGESYDAAHFHAMNVAKLDLAGKIETDVTQLIAIKLANKELSQKQAASLVESAAASKNLVSQKLGRVLTPVDVYRDLPNGNVEVRVMVFYSQDLAREAFKQTMREDLEKKADELAKQLDKILGF